MVTIVKRGDIFYADMSPVVGSEQGGIRPVIIIQNDVGNKYSPTVAVAAITSQINKAMLPTQVKISSKEYGLNKDSVILLEQIRTLDKRRLKEKIGTASDILLERIDSALSKELGIKTFKVSLEELKYKKYYSDITKPLVITEGKTDPRIIETAWKKLYPNKEMFFKCKSSGIEFDKEKRQGSAEAVRRELEYRSTETIMPIIGLFDNDRAGNEAFHGLNKKIFEEYTIKNNVRKHINNNVWGMLLPVPDEREIFVTDDDATQRYFVIEHYFSDDVLKRYLMYGKNILGTCVFKVNNRKDKFSKEISNLAPKEFENFKLLFSKLKEVLNIK